MKFVQFSRSCPVMSSVLSSLCAVFLFLSSHSSDRFLLGTTFIAELIQSNLYVDLVEIHKAVDVVLF